jgi:hypothetical protein
VLVFANLDLRLELLLFGLELLDFRLDAQLPALFSV